MKQITITIIDPVTPLRVGLKYLLEHSGYGFSVVAEHCDPASFRKAGDRHTDIITINPIVFGFVADFNVRDVFDGNHSAFFVALNNEYLLPYTLNSFDSSLNIYKEEKSIAGQLKSDFEKFSAYKKEGKRQSLSRREIAVLIGLYNGFSNKEIAGMLDISENTVKSHRKAMIIKTGITSAKQLADYVKEHEID